MPKKVKIINYRKSTKAIIKAYIQWRDANRFECHSAVSFVAGYNAAKRVK